MLTMFKVSQQLSAALSLPHVYHMSSGSTAMMIHNSVGSSAFCMLCLLLEPNPAAAPSHHACRHTKQPGGCA